MKRKKETKKEVRFYINPLYDYKDHQLNVLKECLTEWSNQNSAENKNWKPKFDDFEFHLTHKYENGKEIHVYECNTTWQWISKVKMFDSLFPIIESFGTILNSK